MYLPCNDTNDRQGRRCSFLASRRSSFVSSFFRRTFMQWCHTLIHRNTHRKLKKQRYSVSSLYTLVCLFVCVCACKGTRNVIKRSRKEIYENVHAKHTYVHENDIIANMHKCTHTYTQEHRYAKVEVHRNDFKYETTFSYSWKHTHTYTI